MNAIQNLIRESRHISQMAGDEVKPLPYKPISADSHVVEPPNLYVDYVDPKFRDRVPRTEIGAKGGEVWRIEGVFDDKPYFSGIGGVTSAGVDPKEIKMDTWKYSDINPACYEPKARIEAQECDGVGGEILFPSIGMVVCNLPDMDLRQACFVAYNRWLADFCSHAPDRLFGLGQSGVLSVEQTIADLRDMKDKGFRGAMLPLSPGTEFDYFDVRFDPVWEAASALKMPIAFHIFTSPTEWKSLASTVAGENKGRNMAFFHHAIIRATQDVVSNFVWGRVFERHPDLKLVCAEADAGWVPHFMYRMDHFYRRHRFYTNQGEMAKMPSEYVSDNVYFTYQDDLIAMNSLDMVNPRRLLWASDFPHSDATWPWSQQLLAYQTQHMTDEERRWILRDNQIECFNLPLD